MSKKVYIPVLKELMKTLCINIPNFSHIWLKFIDTFNYIISFCIKNTIGEASYHHFTDEECKGYLLSDLSKLIELETGRIRVRIQEYQSGAQASIQWKL